RHVGGRERPFAVGGEQGTQGLLIGRVQGRVAEGEQVLVGECLDGRLLHRPAEPVHDRILEPAAGGGRQGASPPGQLVGDLSVTAPLMAGAPLSRAMYLANGSAGKIRPIISRGKSPGRGFKARRRLDTKRELGWCIVPHTSQELGATGRFPSLRLRRGPGPLR